MGRLVRFPASLWTAATAGVIRPTPETRWSPLTRYSWLVFVLLFLYVLTH
jgi:hypothetical protein